MEQMIAISRQNPLSILVKFGMMAWNNSCGIENCSGHGECHNGTCLCEIQFDGPECHIPNLSYYVAFATIFFLLAFVCLIQLVMCIVAEWQRMKAPSFLRACRVTTQKVLYFVVFLASIIRGAYFTSPTAFKEGWSRSLLSAYYPLLLSGSSLIVCFWAEVFHLRDIRWDKPQFLSKSFLAFVVFNIITYSLLLAEFITAQTYSQQDQSFYTHVFNGCYAVLLFIVVVLFLIYGVEVFFKVRGGFLNEYRVASIATNKRTADEAKIQAEDQVTAKLFDPIPSTSTTEPLHMQQVNTSQLHQSRFGLLSQAFMLFIIVGFLFSETLSEFWKTKVPLYSRNWHDVVFRVIEVGVALWFPCVLWNCMSPEQLWILNPKRILKRLDLDQGKHIKEIELQEKNASQDTAFLPTDGTSINSKDCWICYDNDRQDAGPLIQPCHCRGDVSAVHHDCLRRWLVESSVNADSLICKVCNTKYNVEHASRLDWQNSLTPRHCLQTIAIVTTMCASSAAAWVVIQFVEGSIIRMFAAGTALLIMYVCIRFLSLYTVVAYQRAKISSLNIVNSDSENSGTAHVTTISHTNSVDLMKSDMVTI
ncbi:E3 ubiquitin-protein ligase MARCH2 [Camponotus floridanus]|uniref:E3 ubiquitin-protein ligase MARCH2 n=1 Tax=Camponotus floridanus TaxID=104421 RepID=E2AXV2_CAMFO|nr:E3 ubiquitin-protein ligase MARCH2 [Camponotus floridanus]